MDAGDQKDDLSMKADALPDAEALYNQIMHANSSPEEVGSTTVDPEPVITPPNADQTDNTQAETSSENASSDEVDDAKPLPLESGGFDPGGLEMLPEAPPADSAEDTSPIPAELVELDSSPQIDPASVDVYSGSVDDTLPVPAEGIEMDEEPQLDPAAGAVLSNSFDDTLPIPAEVVELDENPLPDPQPGASSPQTGDFSEPVSSLDDEASGTQTVGTMDGDFTLLPVDNFSPSFTVQEVAPGEIPKKIALILSGGGARGAFQVGAELYARQVKGYHWDIIAGVSVGAMNGAMLSMHRYARLLELWNTISDDRVYTGGFTLFSVIKLLFGAKSFYGNEPLQKLMMNEFEAGKVIDDLHVGAVSLITGDYVQFTKEFLELPAAILASGSIPVIWPPVDVSPEHISMVDGGVRNNSPVGDVLALEPDEIVIMNCSPQTPAAMPCSPQNVLSIGMRALDIMQNEIFVNDVKEFQRINALVQEAEQNGVVLHHPGTGRPFKYYPSIIIEPNTDLGETLDFSQHSVQASLRAGVKRAREVLGRP